VGQQEVTSSPWHLFDARADVLPGEAFEAIAARIPNRWAVCLLTDELDRPVQLVCFKDPRRTLRSRMTDAPPAPENNSEPGNTDRNGSAGASEGGSGGASGGVSAGIGGGISGGLTGGTSEGLGGGVGAGVGVNKRVDYRGLVRFVHYRRVDSQFEADWWYLEAARLVFPASYRGMLGYKPAYFVHVDAEARFPQYSKTIDLTVRGGRLLGPLPDKHTAGRLIDLVESAFDLCRYPNILQQAPHGRACAYKGMGKCPAPCDGSISLPQYRRLVEWSEGVLADPREYLREQQSRMRAAAGELAFESAERIRKYIDELSALGTGGLAQLRRLSDFRFVVLQRGPVEGSAKVFVVGPGVIAHVASIPGNLPPAKPRPRGRAPATSTAATPPPEPTPANPGSGLANPGAGLANPGTGLDNPGTGLASPGTGLASPGTGLTNLGVGLANPGTGPSTSGTGPSTSGTGPSTSGGGTATSGAGTASSGAGLAPPGLASLARVALETDATHRDTITDAAAAERLAVVANHLFAATSSKSGIFLPLAEFDDTSLLRGYQQLLKQKPREPTTTTSLERLERQGGAQGVESAQ
jgi:hypothetical protein